MFIKSLSAAWLKNNSLVCVGLDPDVQRFPADFSRDAKGAMAFCREIIDTTADLVCAFKPQIAHFAALSAETELREIIRYIHDRYPDIPVILDAKRGDIGSTAEMYAREAFERYGADAVTVNPYLGFDSVEPFLRYHDKGIVLLCRTSNPGAADLQDLSIDGIPLYQHLAKKIAAEWNSNGNCLLVIGATWPKELGAIREIVGDMPILVPGVGSQGGDVGQVVAQGVTSDGNGLVINSSRAILFASTATDYAKASRLAAMDLRDEINRHRQTQG